MWRQSARSRYKRTWEFHGLRLVRVNCHAVRVAQCRNLTQRKGKVLGGIRQKYIIGTHESQNTCTIRKSRMNMGALATEVPEEVISVLCEVGGAIKGALISAGKRGSKWHQQTRLPAQQRGDHRKEIEEPPKHDPRCPCEARPYTNTCEGPDHKP